ncbi:MAG: hypothetical protein B7X00_00070 [Legionella sp. 21-45-4]|nr:MAG: hypothetical protein B7X00_00070 [Legionella sp. 21-45-4]
MFSLLGLDTYSELTPFFAANPPVKTPVFMDMHPVGDALLANHFIDPVVDMQRIVALYPNWQALKAGLYGFEWDQNTAHSHPHDIMHLHDETGRFPLTYEVIFGQAWTGDTLSIQHGNDVFIPVDSLRRR